MRNILILVITCQAHRSTRQQAIRDTWARHAHPSQRILFVEGGHSTEAIHDDRIELTTPDGYEDLAEKGFRAMECVLGALEFEGIIKCDDDTYLDCPRLAEAVEAFGDYRGNPTADQTQFKPYAQGGCYWLSRRAMTLLVKEPFQAHGGAPWFKGNSRMRKRGEKTTRDDVSIEDVMVGDLLSVEEVSLEVDRRFHDQLRPVLWLDRSILSHHYVSPDWMYRIERMRCWPETPFRRFLMRLWTLLPGSSKPK